MRQSKGAERGLSKEVIANRSLLVTCRSTPVFTRAAEVQRIEVRAIGEVAAQAGDAVAAPHVGQDDMVARLQLLDGSADLFDHACPFVSEHDRHGHGVQLVASHHVGVAHAGCHDPHQHLVGARSIQRQRFDLERAALLADHRRRDLAGVTLLSVCHFRGPLNRRDEAVAVPLAALPSPLLIVAN
jgi:hypothetical protein